MQNLIHLLTTKRFLPLFITQFMGAFNDNAFKNALLIMLTYDMAQKNSTDAAFWVMIAAALFTLPYFLFSTLAGQIADKYEKSLLAKKIKIAEIILMCVCAVCFMIESIYGLLCVLFLMGTQSTFFSPIKYSLLPRHLKDNELIGGNALVGGGTFLAILFGTIYGSLVIRLDNGVAILSITIITMAIVGWLSSTYIPKTPIGDKKLKVNWNIIIETAHIIQFARKDHQVWITIISISWFWLIGAMFLMQFPIYTKEIIRGSEHVVTLFLTLFSIGIASGAVCCNKLLKGRIDTKLAPYGALGMAIAVIIFFGASNVYETQYIEHVKNIGSAHMVSIEGFLLISKASWIIVVSLLMLAISAGIYVVPLYANMQHKTKGEYLARVIAANNILNALFMVCASALAIILSKFKLNVAETLLFTGCLNIPVIWMVHKMKHRS